MAAFLPTAGTTECATIRHDFHSLVDATRVLTDDRDALKQRVAELEAINNRMADMLWGRRSERRSPESPNQLPLPFADAPLTAAEQEIIEAQARADEAGDEELLARLKARRKARQAKRGRGREEFPANIERRVRRIDLPEEQKQGLWPARSFLGRHIDLESLKDGVP